MKMIQTLLIIFALHESCTVAAITYIPDELKKVILFERA